jgi:ssDNA-binding Zn-finger/Zn-ribbon topoisomerase 1
MIKSFSKDPQICKKCGFEMELWEIRHNKYGKIFYLPDLAK